jgi:hypothetical protein
MEIDAGEFGRNIVEGIAKGITSGIDSAVTAAGDLVRRIKNAITRKDAMDMQSPSKVMQEYGEMVGQGLANGIKNKKSEVEKQTENLVKVIKQVSDVMLDDLAKSVKLLEAELKLESKALGENATETQKLSVKLKELNLEAESVTKRIEILNAAYEESKQRLGENAEETKEYKYQLELARLELQGLQIDITNTNAKIVEQTSQTRLLEQAMQDLEYEMEVLEIKHKIEQTGLSDSATEQEKYNLKIKQGKENLDQLSKQLEIARQRYEASKQATGETSDETQNLYLALLQAELAYKSLYGEINAITTAYNKQADAANAAAAASRAAAQARNDQINREGDDAAQGVGVSPSNDPAILNAAQQVYNLTGQVVKDLQALDNLIASDSANAEVYKEAQKALFKDYINAGGLPRYLDQKYANQFGYAYDYIHHGPQSDKYTEDIQLMLAVQDLIKSGAAATVTPASNVDTYIDQASGTVAAKAEAKAQGDAAKAQVNALASQHNQLVYDIRERGVKDYDGTIAAQISSLASQIASLIAQIDVFDKKAGIKGWKPPTLEQLYMLATGGIVTRPTLAMVGEAGESEAVLPLSNLLPMMTDALLGAVATLGGSTTSIANSTTKQVNLYLVNRGTVVGQGGMEEFARSVSKQISKDFGLAVGGAW